MKTVIKSTIISFILVFVVFYPIAFIKFKALGGDWLMISIIQTAIIATVLTSIVVVIALLMALFRKLSAPKDIKHNKTRHKHTRKK